MRLPISIFNRNSVCRAGKRGRPEQNSEAKLPHRAVFICITSSLHFRLCSLHSMATLTPVRRCSWCSIITGCQLRSGYGVSSTKYSCPHTCKHRCPYFIATHSIVDTFKHWCCTVARPVPGEKTVPERTARTATWAAPLGFSKQFRPEMLSAQPAA